MDKLIFYIILSGFVQLYFVNGVPSQFSPNKLLSEFATVLREATVNFTPNGIFSTFYSEDGFNTQRTFDYVIVGSGPAGSVIANRLSENPHWNILLIEVGRPENFISDVPVVYTALQGTNYDWGYRMERVDGACLGMYDQQCPWPRGKALGGSSVINDMMYTRGNRYDFDRWVKLGNPGWSWNEVVPYYIKSERAKLKKADPGLHGTDGYLSVEDVPYRTPLLEAFLQSGRETGRRILDYNGYSQFGFSPVQATTRNGRRCSAAKAFIAPAQNRPNLKILYRTLATKILIDPKTQTAYGVEYLRNEKWHVAYAQKEVILSAGTFSSPQLLMLSGVGPEKHLQELDIPVIKNLPVGNNLQDHVTFVGLTFLINSGAGLNVVKALMPNTFVEYAFGQGLLTNLGGVEALGYIKTKISEDKEEDYPDVELIFLASSLNTDGGAVFREALHMNQSLYDDVYGPINFQDVWSVIPMLLHPKSKGYLRLKSRNIFDHPILHGNYYTDPERKDIRTMIEAIKEIIRLSKTSGFQKYGSKLHNIPFPNCRHVRFGSDDYWECCLRTISPSLHHQVGTCRMGPQSDPEAVVNNRCQVHGIKRLRVADTSVIPFALSAHTNAPSFMIGERVADFIKEDWYNSNSV